MRQGPWWAIPASIVVGLVLAGLVVGLLVGGGDEGGAAPQPTPTSTPTPAPARGEVAGSDVRAVAIDTPRQRVVRLLGAPADVPAGQPRRRDGRECSYYLATDEGTTYQLCFDRRGRLASSATIGAITP